MAKTILKKPENPSNKSAKGAQYRIAVLVERRHESSAKNFLMKQYSYLIYDKTRHTSMYVKDYGNVAFSLLIFFSHKQPNFSEGSLEAILENQNIPSAVEIAKATFEIFGWTVFPDINLYQLREKLALKLHRKAKSLSTLDVIVKCRNISIHPASIISLLKPRLRVTDLQLKQYKRIGAYLYVYMTLRTESSLSKRDIEEAWETVDRHPPYQIWIGSNLSTTWNQITKTRKAPPKSSSPTIINHIFFISLDQKLTKEQIKAKLQKLGSISYLWAIPTGYKGHWISRFDAIINANKMLSNQDIINLFPGAKKYWIHIEYKKHPSMTYNTYWRKILPELNKAITTKPKPVPKPKPAPIEASNIPTSMPTTKPIKPITTELSNIKQDILKDIAEFKAKLLEQQQALIEAQKQIMEAQLQQAVMQPVTPKTIQPIQQLPVQSTATAGAFETEGEFNLKKFLPWILAGAGGLVILIVVLVIALRK